MKINKKQLKEIIRKKLNVIKEEIVDYQGNYDNDFKFKKGLKIKDVNPGCKYHRSEGIVSSTSGNDVTYEVTNSGKAYNVGDKLTIDKGSLKPLSNYTFLDKEKDHESVKGIEGLK